MNEGIDSRIQARVRILLARRWIDLRWVTIGSTNGVVYIGGDLHAQGGPDPLSEGAWGDRGRHWLERLRREIAEIPEVADVVFQLEPSKGETGWRRRSA